MKDFRMAFKAFRVQPFCPDLTAEGGGQCSDLIISEKYLKGRTYDEDPAKGWEQKANF